MSGSMVHEINSPYSIPTELLNAILGRRLYIEFLDMGHLSVTGDPARDAARALQPDKRKNHAIIRILFSQEIAIESDYYYGICIDMQVDQGGSMESNRAYYEHDITKGKLTLKFIRYDDPPRNSMHTLSVDLTNHVSVADLISIINDYRLDQFNFTQLGATYVGCRDFV